MRKGSFLFVFGSLILWASLCFPVQAVAQNLDIRLLRDINVHRNKSLDGVMKVLTNADYPVSVAIPVAELMVGYRQHDTAAMVNGLATIAGYAVNTVVTFGLKYAVNRPRPYTTYPDLDPYQKYDDQSFPSGHASFAFCSATALSLCYPRWYIVVPAYAWASAVSYSRLHLGVHYPSDVLAGAIVGSGSAWLAVQGNRWLQRHRHRRNSDPDPAH